MSRAIGTSELDALYAKLKPKGVTVSALLAKAVGVTLAKHPIMNAAYAEDAIKYNANIDVAMAVAEHRGHSKAAIKAIKRPPPAPGGVRSPPDISMDSSKLERAAGLRFRPLSDMLGTAFP